LKGRSLYELEGPKNKERSQQGQIKVRKSEISQQKERRGPDFSDILLRLRRQEVPRRFRVGEGLRGQVEVTCWEKRISVNPFSSAGDFHKGSTR